MAQQPILGVTNIPQDIKLELNNGTLTLKSGSIITYPNGNQYQTTSDITYTTSLNRTWMVFYYNGVLHIREPSNCFSGSTAPTDYKYMFWYDTTNNIIKLTGDYGATWSGNFSFPIAIITASNGAISSIDKVFNGFGYIGSSIFVLPYVEGYYPNGYDGFTPKFGTRKLNSLTVYTITSALSNRIMAISSSSTIYPWGGDLESVNKLPSADIAVAGKRYYNKSDNYVYVFNGSVFNKLYDVPFAYCTTTGLDRKVSLFNVVNPFLSVDFWDISDYSKYLANLLIIQYNSKPRATMTIQSLGRMFPVDLLLSVRDGFNIDTATGDALDILAKYIGVSRGYTNSDNNSALLTDEEFRVLLKLKIIVNNGTGTLYGLETNLYNLFGTGIRVVEDKDAGGNQVMSLTYYIRSDWVNVGLAAVQQDVLPHPTGVGYGYNLAAQVKYFGFVDYLDQNHPYSTGFRDYNNPTKQGEMFAYDKVIS